jgi:hypothetical protein
MKKSLSHLNGRLAARAKRSEAGLNASCLNLGNHENKTSTTRNKPNLRLLFLGAMSCAALIATINSSRAQGCVASPNNPLSPICPADFSGLTNSLHQWIVSLDYRWYRSDRHFVNDLEQQQRQALGNEVINDVHSFDVAATYGLSERWSATLTCIAIR